MRRWALLTAVFHERVQEMKHIKTVSKDARPVPAFVWEWPGIVKQSGVKQGYLNALFASPDSLDPNDINDVGLFLP